MRKQNKVATPATYYTTVSLATNKSKSLKSVIPFELIGKLKIKQGDNLFWRQTEDNKILVWRRKNNERIPHDAIESGTSRINQKKKIPPPKPISKPAKPTQAPPVQGSNTGTTDGTQPQISGTEVI